MMDIHDFSSSAYRLKQSWIGDFIMVIKMNYNFIAFVLSIVVVLVFCVVELAIPPSINVEATNVEEQIELPVVMYHHLSTSSNRLGDYVISPKQLEDDLKYIQKCGYETISAKQLIDFNEKGTPLPEKPIMITFDDGNESVHEYAFPLLQQYEMKAILSVIGKHTDIFSKENEVSNINYSHVKWSQLKEMQESGIFEIGNHTYDMHDNPGGKRYGVLKKQSESEEAYRQALIDDIGGLSDQIEREVGVRPFIFAYPFGKFSKETKPVIEEMGYKVIFTCEEKVNKLKPDMQQPLSLKRFNRASRYSTEGYFKRLGLEE